MKERWKGGKEKEKEEIVKERRTSGQISNRDGAFSSFAKTPEGSTQYPTESFK